jgi:hypothetical protein
MQPVIVNTIVNYERDSELASAFEVAFNALRDEIEIALDGVRGTSDLRTVYIQFQFDAAGELHATRGRKIGRYSATKRHTSATIEISAERFREMQERDRLRMLAKETVEVLSQVERTLSPAIAHSLAACTHAITSRFWPAPA